MQIVQLNNNEKQTIIASWEEFKAFRSWLNTNSTYTILEIDMMSIDTLILWYNKWPDKLAYEVTCENPSSNICEDFSSNIRVVRHLNMNITDQRREDMLVGALEGGSNYWCFLSDKACDIITKYSTPPTYHIGVGIMWKAIQAGETIPIHDNEDRKTKIGELDLEAIKKGEELMLKEQPEHFANIISENDDAETADVWFQYCVLGGIVYG